MAKVEVAVPRIAVTHDVADFDGFASAVAARHLHPGLQIVLRRAQGPRLAAYLALHKDRFPYLRHDTVDPEAVEELVVVDVRARSRLQDFVRLIERVERGEVRCEIWDHHPARPDDLRADVAHVEPLGAIATRLVEELRARGIAPTPEEATLFALGIHEDTGSLTHDTTTGRDAAAIEWLLGCGARLGVVRRYLSPSLDPTQRALLTALLEQQRTVRCSGVSVAIARVHIPAMVEGLGPVVTQAFSLGRAAALFAIFDVGGKKVQVTGRARAGALDVGRALRVIGGGGHAGAGSAVRRGADPAEIEAELEAGLREHAHAPSVADVMTSPVQTVDVDTPLTEVSLQLAEDAHSGTPVMRDGRLAGVLSRRDLVAARAQGRDHLAAKSCMKTQVVSIEEGATLDEALALMVDHQVGRLPVLRDGALVGIVSRTDVRRWMYGETECETPSTG